MLIREGSADVCSSDLADTLLRRDASGSKSHRAGLAVVSGQDAAYYGWPETKDQVDDLEALGERLLRQMAERMPDHPDVTRLTLESALCTYKSWHKPNSRYPNVYADMAYLRIRKAESRSGPRVGPLWSIRREARRSGTACGRESVCHYE